MKPKGIGVIEREMPDAASRLDVVADRLARWARELPQESRSPEYCMSGTWNDFYQKLLYPEGVRQVGLIEELIEKLRERGFRAELKEKEANSRGQYLYMRMEPIR